MNEKRFNDTQQQDRDAAEFGSALLRKEMNAAFRKHANKWDIRADQARALLLDRKAVA